MLSEPICWLEFKKRIKERKGKGKKRKVKD
jgi:hypothetical protein